MYTGTRQSRLPARRTIRKACEPLLPNLSTPKLQRRCRGHRPDLHSSSSCLAVQFNSIPAQSFLLGYLKLKSLLAGEEAARCPFVQQWEPLSPVSLGMAYVRSCRETASAAPEVHVSLVNPRVGGQRAECKKGARFQLKLHPPIKLTRGQILP